MPDRSWFPEDEDAGYTGAIHDGAVYEGVEPETDDDRPDPPPEPEPDTEAAPDEPVFTTYTTADAALRGGEIVVTATESGLPMALRVQADQLRRDPAELADDLLRLCRLAANRAGLTRRTDLAALGITDRALDLLGLPTQDAVEQNEIGDENDHGYEPRSWLDRDGSVW
ncbi:hypothetical protein [Nocardia sp. alder85J]|uniref:hypothetical protein n=1 Tax=Nocardia sp. alder85J TaxID=2862949 RepID=UPI001CD586CB|nr:hypothetical protein [Nocardia sp. alder85J]MCX4093073.1 hypothetical protein [Nocardia sp. alder85J]